MDYPDTVPNQRPATEPGAVRLAIVGESPAVEEVHWALCGQGHGFSTRHWAARQLVDRVTCPFCGSGVSERRPTPFCGESGRLLNDLLSEAGLPRAQCFVGNCSRQPLGEAEKTLDHCGPGLERLAVDLEDFAPNVVLTLGNLALHAFGVPGAVSNWRGSLYEGQLAGRTYKCVAAMHPAAVLREPSQLCLLRWDVARGVAEAATPVLNLPKRVIWHPIGNALEKSKL